MSKIRKNTHVSAAFAVSIWAMSTVLAAPAAGEQISCFDDWSTAAPVAQREGLLTLDRLTSHIAERHDGKVLRAALCKTPNSYVYRVLFKTDSGRLATLILNARP